MTDRNPELRIRFTKRADGSAVLQCTRRDGTTTCQRHPTRRAGFFVFHDLRHFAVERTLGIDHGFFGLLAEGWNIPDTEGKGPRGALPSEALAAEQLVGLLDRERIGGAAQLTAPEIRAELAKLLPHGTNQVSDALTDERLTAIRDLVDELHAKWAATDVEMELTFDRGQFAP
jgi:hypothetical protein